MQMLRQYAPLVETYIQLLKPDEALGTVPAGDKYFLGKADLAKGPRLAAAHERQRGPEPEIRSRGPGNLPDHVHGVPAARLFADDLR